MISMISMISIISTISILYNQYDSVSYVIPREQLMQPTDTLQMNENEGNERKKWQQWGRTKKDKNAENG